MTAWVLLRGLTREARHWGAFPQQLQRRLGAERVVCLDFPGNGTRYRETSLAAVEAMAGFCHREVRALGIETPVRVLAMSLGAMAAVAWAQSHPEDLAGAVLVNTSLRGFSPFYRRLRPASCWRLARRLSGAAAADIERTILDLTSTRAAADATEAARLVEDWCRWRREQPVAAANALRQLWAAASYRPASAAPVVPLLVLASHGDRMVDPQCSLRLAAAWNTAQALHPSAGHDLPLDDPGWTLQQIERWIADGNVRD